MTYLTDIDPVTLIRLPDDTEPTVAIQEEDGRAILDFDNGAAVEMSVAVLDRIGAAILQAKLWTEEDDDTRS